MTAPAYLIGVLLTCVVACSVLVVALVVRRWLLPDWAGPPAWVAEAVIAVAVLLLLGELLGTLGWFRRWPLVGGCAGVALVALLADRAATRHGRRGPAAAAAAATGDTSVGASRSAHAYPGAGAVAGIVLLGFLLLLPWTYTTLNAIHHGIREYDSLSYHLPFAARFAQTGSTTAIPYMGNPPVSFYPLNSELIHAVGMLLFRRDVLSLVINFGWLALALVAGWCIGRPRGVALGTMAATALVLSARVTAFSQGGTAKNDVMGLSLLLAAVALLSQRKRFRGEILLVALAGGLAVGTRLDLWPAVVALALIVTVAMLRESRLATSGQWVVGIIVGGGYWYARNLAQAGNPVPWVGGSIAGVLTLPSTTPPVDCGTTTVAHYLPHPAFLAAHILPQLDPFLGRLWWIVVGLAALGTVAGLLSRSAPQERALALLALVTFAAYLLTPASAGGTNASCFGYNTRFLVPALMLGMVLVPLWLARRRVYPAVAVLGSALLIAIDAHIPLTLAPLLASALVALCLGALFSLGRRRLSPTALASLTILLGVIAIAGGWEVQRVYLRGRYAQPRLQQPVDGAALVLRHVSGARIAVSGFFETYPLDGVAISNQVSVPARRIAARFRPDTSCRTWLAALSRGHYQYAVTAEQGSGLPPAAAWTRRFPGALLLGAATTTRASKPWRWEVFALPRRSSIGPAAACP
ncbi:MAG: hypothetical protein JO321_11280 [Solirubrobacterales bacterium]|nr:hypothetical protein [Solirubrobacterales bacterium]MBV9535980.1 hypothetical protein [Solirubrobacterales bacterium]